MELIGASWRQDLRELMRSANSSALVACPFVKEPETQMLVDDLCCERPSPPELVFVTALSANSAVTGALDITALVLLTRRLARATIVNLPRLHAKVYIADTRCAIVTSGNLTRSGLDVNLEYGLLVRDGGLVAQIREDVERYASLGRPVDVATLESLSEAADELASAHREVQKSVSYRAKRRFKRILASTEVGFIRSFVGERTKNSVFSDCLLFALRAGPMLTADIHRQIRELVPELCDDSRELVIDGERFGKAWKHDVRNAQQYLKRQGAICFDPSAKKWQLGEE